MLNTFASCFVYCVTDLLIYLYRVRLRPEHLALADGSAGDQTWGLRCGNIALCHFLVHLGPYYLTEKKYATGLEKQLTWIVCFYHVHYLGLSSTHTTLEETLVLWSLGLPTLHPPSLPIYKTELTS